MDSSPRIQYFLGANSPSGFYSLYHELLPSEQARSIYILKGGPGCGKSTLMRRVAALAEEAGETVEYILCSGDPDSLDAIVLPQKQIALVDGTAPHVVEPKYPGLVEQYVNLGACYQKDGLQSIRQELMSCMKGYKGCYQRAYRCLGAAAEIFEDMRCTLLTDQLEDRLAKRAKGILQREVPRRKNVSPGAVRQRFLGAVTHQGVLCLTQTAQVQCSKIFELSDRWGLAYGLLSHLLAGVVNNGYDVVACPDPMAPDRLAHLIFPSLSLAFVTSTPEAPWPYHSFRRLRIDSMTDSELCRIHRPRIRFTKRVASALMEDGVSGLTQAKTAHDRLERLYNPYVDFDRVAQIADSLADEILASD